MSKKDLTSANWGAITLSVVLQITFAQIPGEAFARSDPESRESGKSDKNKKQEVRPQPDPQCPSGLRNYQFIYDRNGKVKRKPLKCVPTTSRRNEKDKQDNKKNRSKRDNSGGLWNFLR